MTQVVKYQRVLRTHGRGKEPLSGTVTVEVDWERLVRVLGAKAALNKSGISRSDIGIIVRWRPNT